MAKIQNKRSKVLQEGSAKKPTAEQTEYGELCINYSTEDPALFIKDSNENIIRIAGKGANGATELPETGGEPHQPGTTDDRYVEVAGDTMTGSLTVAGNLVVGDTDTGGTNTGAYILSAGVFGATRANDGDSLWTGYKTGSSTATSYIAASGEALFKGTLTSSPSAAAYAYQINNEDTNLGGLYKDTSSSRLILGDGITSKVDIKGSDGSASFDGGITSGTTTNLGYIQTAGQGGLYGYIFATETQNGGTVALNYKADGNQTAFVVTNAAGKTAANINWSGAALFAGQIEAYGGLADGNAGVQLGQGYIAARSTRSDSGQPILDLINSDGTVVHTVAADGSSSFAGNLDVGDNKGSSSGTGLYMQANGQAYLFTGGASDALNIYQGVDRNVFINSSGSATFKGTVVSGGNPNSGAARGTSINQFGTVRAANTSGTLFEGYTVGITTPTSQIYTSGSASFKGNTNIGQGLGTGLGIDLYATGEIRGRVAANSPDGVQLLKLSRGTEDQVIVSANGAATFKGPLSVQDFKFEAAFNYTNLLTSSTGFWSPDNWSFGPDVSTPSSAVITLNATSGAASFAGDVTGGSLIASSGGSGVIASRSVGGTSSVWRAGDGDFNPDDSATYTSEIKANGSASFGIGTPGSANVTSTLINGLGGIETQAASGNVFIGRKGSDGTATSTINQNGAAEFKGKVTSAATVASDSSATLVTKGYVDDSGSTVGNGALTIKTAGQGSSASGTYTANQSSGSILTLPTIRYGDLSGTPSIPSAANNGKITIKQPGVSPDQTFTVNQSGDTTITLKNDNTQNTPGNGGLTIQTAGHGSSASGSFTANQSSGSTLTLPTIRYGDLSGTPSIPASANNGKITVKQPGTTDQTFTVNQSGETTITLKNDNTQRAISNLSQVCSAGNSTSGSASFGGQVTTPRVGGTDSSTGSIRFLNAASGSSYMEFTTTYSGNTSYGYGMYRFRKASGAASYTDISFKGSVARVIAFPDQNGTVALTTDTPARSSAANQVSVNAVGGNTNYWLALTDPNANTTGNGNIYKDNSTGLYFNPSTETLVATKIFANGAGISNVNALTLGTIGASQFVRSDTSDTIYGTLGIQSTDQLLLHTANKPCVVHRNDGSNYYVLLTNSVAQPSASFNALRPLYIDCATGVLKSSNGQTFYGNTSLHNQVFLPNVYSRTTGLSGQVVIAANGELFRSTSSRRYKDNIRDAASPFGSSTALDLVSQMQPRVWEDYDTGESSIGFIAEELFEIGGENLVSFSPWTQTTEVEVPDGEGTLMRTQSVESHPLVGNGTTPVTKDGGPLTNDSEVVDGLNNNGITVTLVQALQEAASKIADLESRLAAAGIA